MISVYCILASEDEHGVRPYANVVGASDPARKMHGLGQDNSMFARASRTNRTQAKTEVKQ